MTFDLGTINWQAISAVLTFLGIIGAYIFPVYRDRKRLELSLSTDSYLLTDSDYKVYKVEILMTNKGRFPITITSYLIGYKSKKKLELFPLKDWTQYKYVLLNPELELAREITIPYKGVENITRFYCVDTLGKKWALRKKDLEVIRSLDPLNHEITT